MDQFIRFINFRLERWIQRGILHQILLVASAIALIAVAFGVAGWASTEAFESPFEAIWWAFLRLTDPGYLGDDEGSILRTLSTIVTVLGYVLFMGSLVANGSRRKSSGSTRDSHRSRCEAMWSCSAGRTGHPRSFGRSRARGDA
jgi:hypothetical protein